MDLNDLLAEVEGIGEDRFTPSKAFLQAKGQQQAQVPPTAPTESKKTAGPQPVADPSVQPTPTIPTTGSDKKPTARSEESPREATQPGLQVEQLFGQRHKPKPAELGSLDMILDVELELTVELGKTRIPLKELMRILPGHEFTLDQYPDHPLGIYVNERLVAYGEALIVDGSLAIKVTEILSPANN